MLPDKSEPSPVLQEEQGSPGLRCSKHTASSANSSPQTYIPKEKVTSLYTILEATGDGAKASKAITSFGKKPESV